MKISNSVKSETLNGTILKGGHNVINPQKRQISNKSSFVRRVIRHFNQVLKCDEVLLCAQCLKIILKSLIIQHWIEFPYLFDESHEIVKIIRELFVKIHL